MTEGSQKNFMQENIGLIFRSLMGGRLTMLFLCSDEAMRFLRSCWILSIVNNHLSGKIPDAMGSLGRLWVLTLDNNRLSGELPDAMRAMWSLRLRWFGEALPRSLFPCFFFWGGGICFFLLRFSVLFVGVFPSFPNIRHREKFFLFESSLLVSVSPAIPDSAIASHNRRDLGQTPRSFFFCQKVPTI